MLNQFLRFTGLTKTMGIVVLSVLPTLGYTHSGHEHGGAAKNPAPSQSKYAKLILNSDQVELVAVARDPGLWIYLDSFTSNEPINDAIITLETGEHKIVVNKADSNGVYLAKMDWLNKPGKYDFVISIESNNLSDLLTGTLELNGSKQQTISPIRDIRNLQWYVGIAVLLGLVGIVLIVKKVNNSRRSSAAGGKLKSVSTNHAAAVLIGVFILKYTILNSIFIGSIQL